MSELSDKLNVLLKECDHVQESISRFLGAVSTVFGVGLPAILGIFLFSAKVGERLFPSSIMGVGLAIAMSITVMFSNAMWMEAIHGMRYKYGVLLPRLYELIGGSGWENFGQHLAKKKKNRDWMPIAILNMSYIIVALGLPTYLILSDQSAKGSAFLLIAIVCAFVVASAASTAYVLLATHRLNRFLDKTARVPNEPKKAV